MTVFTTNRPFYSHAPISGFLSALAASFLSWNDRRVTRNALSGLTTRELEDIGLTRGDVASM